MNGQQAFVMNRPVSNWLFVGVAMIMVQVLLGGITRLTGSGLSITEWQPILGTIPPLNEAEWNRAFEQYKQIGQYKQIHFYFTLSDFKFIYFWEWFHRVWARLMAVAFAVPFIYFLVKGYFKRSMIFSLLLLFVLGGVQGLLGWIMVKSGLNTDDIYVSHFRLAIHFMAALGLLVYVLWFGLTLRIPEKDRCSHLPLKKASIAILTVLLLQFVFGAFMAGLKAAAAAPTWPTINGSWMPDVFNNGWVNDPVAIHFIHRGLAYILLLLVFYWWSKMRRLSVSDVLRTFMNIPPLLIIVQVLLGIATVVFSSRQDMLLLWGALHQFIAMLLLSSWVVVIYLLSGTASVSRGSV